MNKQGKSQFTETQQQALMLLGEVYKKQTGKDPKQDQQGFGQFVNQLQQKTGIKDVGQFLDAIYQQAQQQASNQQPPQQQQTLAARHGIKLNYIKALKNQCPDGQEPYYYKKGGMIKCGCTGKKFEDGGEVKKENAISRFKKTITSKKSNLGEGIKKGMKTTTDSVVKTAKAKQWSDEYKRTTKASGKKDWVVGDKCGGKVKKHQIGGYVDYPANQALHNVGDKIGDTIESTGYAGDFLPIVSTLKAAREIGTGRPNASWGKLITSGIGDAVGFGMMGSVAKAASRYGRIAKNLKANGYFRPTDTGTQWIKIGTKETPINAGRFGTIGTKTEPAVYVKNVPEVDYYGVAMQPMIQSMRVPFTAPFVKEK